jgi:hypothetical protein
MKKVKKIIATGVLVAGLTMGAGLTAAQGPSVDHFDGDSTTGVTIGDNCSPLSCNNVGRP